MRKMKSMRSLFVKFYLPLLLLLVAGVALLAVPKPPAQNVTTLLPAGPLLVLEAGDFSSLVRGWNQSPEKARWLQSASYESFARSRLFLRLKSAQEEFAAAAGLPPDMRLVESVAGSESALGLYDTGHLEFLYVSRLSSARAMESVLGKWQNKFEPRKAAGAPYYVREDKKEERFVGFAATEGFLLLATREDLLTDALLRLSEKTGATVADEPWYQYAVRAAPRPGDLRLVMNFEKVAALPHFRSYWIHDNQQELRTYKAALSDIHLDANAIREERVFLPELSETAIEAQSRNDLKNPNEEAVADLLRLVPDNAGLYRAWAQTQTLPAQAQDLFTRKILRLDAQSTGQTQSLSAQSSTDSFEIRIDQPPTVVRTGGFDLGELTQILDKIILDGLLHLQTSRTGSSGVFIQNESALVLRSQSGWDPAKVCRALVSSIETLRTASRLGMQCVEKKTSGHTHLALDGLTPLAVAAKDNYLVVATHSDLLAEILNRFTQPAVAGQAQGDYVAGFRHTLERKTFGRMMQLLDNGGRSNAYATNNNRGRVPQFFADNMGSLSHTLQRVESVTLSTRQRGALQYQTVTYQLTP